MNITPINVNDEVERLLSNADLPVGDLHHNERLELFGISEAGRIMAIVGIEQHDDAGLLRSLVVDKSLRKSGYGEKLVTHAETLACKKGITSLYLLTTTANDYFSRLGYNHASRDQAPAAIANTPQFSGLCPDSAFFMCKSIKG